MSDQSPDESQPRDPSTPRDPNRPYADFWAPIACKMKQPQMKQPLPPGGQMGHFGTDWDFSEIHELTEIQLRSIELTIQGLSDIRIARRLQINRKTLWRWKTLDPDYRRILASARVQLHAAAVDRYQRLLARATSILAQLLRDADNNRRFAAALAILNMAGAFKPLPLSYFPSAEPPTDPPPELQDLRPEPDLPPKVG